MVERYVDIVEVISSILITPTIIAFKKADFILFTYYFKNNISSCLVIFAKGPHPIPFRTRKLSPSAPMVLCLKIWKSRTLPGLTIMKIASSLKSLKKRDLNSKLVKRRGKLYVINKKNPKFKARQG